MTQQSFASSQPCAPDEPHSWCSLAILVASLLRAAKLLGSLARPLLGHSFATLTSNGARLRLWKLADATDLTLHVHHYPPGTSKWNRIEHRLFCHITQNWRGRPLTDRVAVVELIGATTTDAGLKVECLLDERTYEKGIKISDAEMAGMDITGDAFHPEWNYTIKPRRRQTT